MKLAGKSPPSATGLLWKTITNCCFVDGQQADDWNLTLNACDELCPRFFAFSTQTMPVGYMSSWNAEMHGTPVRGPPQHPQGLYGRQVWCAMWWQAVLLRNTTEFSSQNCKSHPHHLTGSKYSTVICTLIFCAHPHRIYVIMCLIYTLISLWCGMVGITTNRNLVLMCFLILYLCNRLHICNRWCKLDFREGVPISDDYAIVPYIIECIGDVILPSIPPGQDRPGWL